MAAEIAITLLLLAGIASLVVLSWILVILGTELLISVVDSMVLRISWRSSLRRARLRLISRFSTLAGEVRRSW